MYKLLILSIFFIACSNSVEIMEVNNPASDLGKYPRLYTDNIGTVYMSWYNTVGDTTQLYYSLNDGYNWNEPILLAQSDNWFVNWADFSSVIGYNGKALAAHWLQKSSEGTYSYDVKLSTSASNFEEPFIIHSDSLPTEHGFVSMVPLSDSSFYVVWLDGRNMLNGHGHSSDLEEFGDLSNAMTIRGAFIQSGVKEFEVEIDNSTCECCNTSLVTTKNGLLTAYRNRTDQEIRDIHVSSYSNEFNKWSVSRSIHSDNWQIAACPVNGPMMDAIDNHVAIGWFTGAYNQPKVKLSFSDDAGVSFSDPIVVDEKVPLGRVDIVLSNNETAWLSWITRTDNSALLKLAKISKMDGTSKVYDIGEINPSRSTGFPQLTSYKDGLMVAWTNIDGNQPSIKTVIIR
jgi:hypothetical protein